MLTKARTIRWPALEDLVMKASLAVVIIHSLSSTMRVELRSIKIAALD
jgi:hypothetical protein